MGGLHWSRISKLHCWVNENGELQIEQDSGHPSVMAALCLPVDEATLRQVCEALLWAMNDGDDVHNFPGHMLVLSEEKEGE